jgi:hypothetical protein
MNFRHDTQLLHNSIREWRVAVRAGAASRNILKSKANFFAVVDGRMGSESGGTMRETAKANIVGWNRVNEIKPSERRCPESLDATQLLNLEVMSDGHVHLHLGSRSEAATTWPESCSFVSPPM